MVDEEGTQDKIRVYNQLVLCEFLSSSLRHGGTNDTRLQGSAVYSFCCRQSCWRIISSEGCKLYNVVCKCRIRFTMLTSTLRPPHAPSVSASPCQLALRIPANSTSFDANSLYAVERRELDRKRTRTISCHMQYRMKMRLERDCVSELGEARWGDVPAEEGVD